MCNTVTISSGAVRDLSGSYTLSLYVPAACIFFISFLPCVGLLAVTTCARRREELLLQEETHAETGERAK